MTSTTNFNTLALLNAKINKMDRYIDQIQKGDIATDDTIELITENAVLSANAIIAQIDSSDGAITAITLPAGTTGQIKYIVMITAGNNADITNGGVDMVGYTNIRFSSVGHTATLMYNGANWELMHSVGAALT